MPAFQRASLALLAAAAAAWLATLATVDAVAFDLQAFPQAQADSKGIRCLYHWVAKDMFVKGSITVGQGANQVVNVEIVDNSPERNEYFRKADVKDAKFTFRTQTHSEISVCLHNVLAAGIQPDSQWKRSVDLRMSFGVEAKDFAEIAKKEKLKPMEVELRKLEMAVEEIVEDMEFLKRREARMRDTNESTNERVWKFSIFSIVVLCSVGAWQVFYLRRFFQSKKLI
ncbi:MAG: emp24/gp25L/p24 family/GOLD-domain-containing protein [Olpidium bornovanus]|uniref:Emp24/gp25L/p24 family/GOLD-domain-containing protein n=1 Tax=Olpidium bornovanus TaxID=278681 RepID=A0A8H7ZMZ0_9FUNG|nr:MAG: emp24/gp25L/p24 family/GOLD-domain-containing protein [Olpidium bornovanus]